MKHLFLIPLFLMASQSFAGQTRLLAVVDRHAPDVGRGCEKSFNDFKRVLKDITKGHEKEFQIYEWPNAVTPTPGDIMTYYSQTAFAADDILWFYYCGHGGTDPNNGHFLDISQGHLLRSDLKRVMESRKTKAVILTTDACSSPGKFAPTGPMAGGAPPPEVDHWKKLKNLLDGTSGTVDITAASGTSRAFVDSEVGANFTRALTYVVGADPTDLDFNGDKKITWQEVFALIRYQTRTNFSGMVDHVAMMAKQSFLRPDDKDQIPFAYALGAEHALEKINQKDFKLFYLLQQQFSTLGEEFGTRFLIKTNFPESYGGKTVQFQLSFWDIRGKEIMLKPGSRYPRHLNVRLQKDQLAPNDNTPWEIFISENSLVIPVDAKGEEETVWIKLNVYDVTDYPKYTTIHDQMIKLRNVNNPLDPRR